MSKFNHLKGKWNLKPGQITAFDPELPWSGRMIRFQKEMCDYISPEKAKILGPRMKLHLAECELIFCQECDISRIQIKRILEAGLS